MRAAKVRRLPLPALVARGLVFFSLTDAPRAEPVAASKAELAGFLLASLVAGRTGWNNAIRHRCCP